MDAGIGICTTYDPICEVLFNLSMLTYVPASAVFLMLVLALARYEGALASGIRRLRAVFLLLSSFSKSAALGLAFVLLMVIVWNFSEHLFRRGGPLHAYAGLVTPLALIYLFLGLLFLIRAVYRGLDGVEPVSLARWGPPISLFAVIFPSLFIFFSGHCPPHMRTLDMLSPGILGFLGFLALWAAVRFFGLKGRTFRPMMIICALLPMTGFFWWV